MPSACVAQKKWWHCIKAKADDLTPPCRHNISVNFWVH
jgi:hypothetical protein